jgi:hypothetical protein
MIDLFERLGIYRANRLEEFGSILSRSLSSVNASVYANQ